MQKHSHNSPRRRRAAGRGAAAADAHAGTRLAATADTAARRGWWHAGRLVEATADCMGLSATQAAAGGLTNALRGCGGSTPNC